LSAGVNGAVRNNLGDTLKNTSTEQSKNSMFPTMRGPEKQFDREEVLGKAMKLFWNQGYAATGMTQLLTHMGIGRQSLYDTFGDKKSLYLAALERYFAFLGEQWKRQLDAPGSPLGNLKNLSRRIMEVAEETGFCGCFIGNAMAEFGDCDEDIRRVLGRSLDRMEEMLTGALQRAQEAGELSPRARPRDLAKLLIVSIQGSALLSKLEPHRKHAQETLRIAFRVLETS
jgi:TetR/AcrR family transcriptional repressor of nem operon